MARIDRPLRQLYLSALQSRVFNDVLDARLETLDQVQEGDVAWLHRNGACFSVDDVGAAAPRAASFEISPSGPLWGPDCPVASGAQGDLEERVLSAQGLSREAFHGVRGLTGVRRPLRVPLGDPGIRSDGPDLVLEFHLPAGFFATAVLAAVT